MAIGRAMLGLTKKILLEASATQAVWRILKTEGDKAMGCT